MRTPVAVAALILAFVAKGEARPRSPLAERVPPPSSLRLYFFDCGTIHGGDMARFGLKPSDVATTDMSVACYLIVHPKGTLMWDTGAIPDSAWKPTGEPVAYHLRLPDGNQRDLVLRKRLVTQLAEIGYSPADVGYLALSHYHYDHTANADDFRHATWLVRQVERDTMFATPVPAATAPATYAALRDSKTVIIKTDTYDVFGDGTVVIMAAPGHTPGHQMLYVKLAKTGGVLICGDLYHYPEERGLDKMPTIEFNAEDTRLSRQQVDTFLKRTGAQLWIQHDFIGNSKLEKSPHFYE